ncbi:Clavaminate synthase-like protein [Neolentinus lepideus HHB14362 ss-1]|uniref:Clavaminate synthase-like protein n=1 Tax=Neolentinus lepideus HHB14362 ss-1 TaxID=1314782 RepID=A0A165U428_9AGAM|nr:Clavaminate synthase-like protein [Neolentinus lepideus HHB14362 ss-1]
MPGLTLPPFPDNIPTAPLLIIDYSLIRQGHEGEINRMWKAATELGFWYLKNHGTDAEVNRMFDVGAETARLPLEEKMQYEQGDTGASFGYKAAGTIAVDEKGTRDTVEFFNVSQDDALAWPVPIHRTYFPTVNTRMESSILPFVRKSIDINFKLMSVLESKLGLPRGALTARHSLQQRGGSEARCIRSQPRSDPLNETSAAIGAHTDFGSLTILHNRLGGLQVLMPGSEKWLYVKPLPGHAICNVGDTLTVFSAGILRSNLHRVVPPPGDQSCLERWSVVYFTRPAYNVPLKALTEESFLIAEAASKAPAGKYNTGETAGEWVSRRIKYHRLKNRTGPESWRANRGVEEMQS